MSIILNPKSDYIISCQIIKIAFSRIFPLNIYLWCTDITCYMHVELKRMQYRYVSVFVQMRRKMQRTLEKEKKKHTKSLIMIFGVDSPTISPS